MEKIEEKNTHSIDYTQWFNDNFALGLWQVLKFSIQNPAMAWFMAGKLLRFVLSARRRSRWEKQGVQVPPMLIYSVTSACNLDCAGCYAKLLHAPKHGEFDAEKFADVIQQADDIGVSYILVAGGEPFMRPELLDVTGKHPNIIFTPFTNGLLVTDDHIRRLKKQRHVLPIVSFEGYELETDARRGQGVYDNGLDLVSRFHRANIYYGVSLTITRGNFETVTSQAFIKRLATQGCKIFFFINYIPAAAGTEEKVLTAAQVKQLNQTIENYRSHFQALFLAFPGSEIDFGGCLAAGRGFVHINAEGDVEACPFSPYSDSSLRDMSLIEALRSPLLRTIRENDVRLDESDGICALWKEREWVANFVITDSSE